MTTGKVVAYLILTLSLCFVDIYTATFARQQARDYQCGLEAYDDMMWETKTVNILPAIGAACIMIMRGTQALAWTYYLQSAGFDQNISKAMKWFIWAGFIGTSSLFRDLGLIPTWVTHYYGMCSYLILLIINFYVDDPARRKKRNLAPVTNNYFYMVFVTQTVFVVAFLINVAKTNAIEKIEKYGVTAASIVVNFLGIIFTMLYESLTTKAASPGNNGRSCCHFTSD